MRPPGKITPEEIAATLGLQPHPEGGAFRETWRGAEGTAIYFMLRRGERSHWHRVHHADELWHFYAGAPLKLFIGDEVQLLGPELGAGQRPQAVVPAKVWQAAESTGEYTLVGCTVSPAFDFEHFELAPPGWSP